MYMYVHRCMHNECSNIAHSSTCAAFHLEDTSRLEGPVLFSSQACHIDTSWNVNTLCQITNILRATVWLWEGNGKEWLVSSYEHTCTCTYTCCMHTAYTSTCNYYYSKHSGYYRKLCWTGGLSTFNGLWIPSKILSMIPGPSSTDKGLPVRNTGSPIVTPATPMSRNRAVQNVCCVTHKSMGVSSIVGNTNTHCSGGERYKSLRILE